MTQGHQDLALPVYVFRDLVERGVDVLVIRAVCRCITPVIEIVDGLGVWMFALPDLCRDVLCCGVPTNRTIGL